VKSQLGHSEFVKHCLDFSFVFSGSFICVKKPVFSKQAGSCAVEGTRQAVLGSSDQRNVPDSLSLFLKSEKIPALLYVGKGPEYRPFHDFRPVRWAYRPRAQISNHRRATCTQAHLRNRTFKVVVRFIGYGEEGNL
jgi:hypothetical protein